MIKIDTLPKDFFEKAAEHQLQITADAIAVETDLDSIGNYASSWVVFSQDTLYVIAADWAKIETFPMGPDVKEVFAESLVSIGIFTIKTDNGYVEICKFSNTLVRKFSAFAGVLNKIIKQEPVDENDIEKNVEHRCSVCGKYLPDPNMRMHPKCINRKAILLRLAQYGMPYKWSIVGICVLLLLTTLLSMVGPYLSGTVLFDWVLVDNHGADIWGIDLYGNVLPIIGIMILFRLFSMIVSMIYSSFIAKVSGEMVFRIKTDVFEAMQRLSMRFFSNKMTGNLMTRINSDTNEILYFFIDGVPYVITSVLNIVAMGSFMIALNPWLGLLCLIPPPFIFLFFRKFMPKFKKMNNVVFRRRSSMNSHMNDSFSGVRVIKAFGKEEDEVSQFQRRSMSFADSAIKVDMVSSTVFPIIGQSLYVMTLLVYVIGGLFIIHGGFTFGTMMTYIGYIGIIFNPMSGLANTVTWASYAMNAANRVFEVIDAQQEIKDCEQPVALPQMRGEVSLKNVSFSYEVNKPVLHHITVDVRAGEMIGLVGHSGAGKSTITNLITRLYDVNEGEITIDGIPIKQIRLEDLRRQIGMVLQDTYLFMGTIAENIAYAKPDATMEEIIQAAKAAHAHDFIVQKPDGYDTVVGVGGADLSGGEKQRLSIARAILHNPRILILDEATSALDTETEQHIQEAMETLVKGRTTFAIAHRLSTLRNADRLMVIEKGKLVELGTHEELYRLEGVYYKLHKLQQEALKIRGIGDGGGGPHRGGRRR